MSERGIIMTGESVLAILAGTKTQTRRMSIRYAVGDLLWVKEAWQAWRQTSVESDEWEAITREVRAGMSWSDYIDHRGYPDRIEYRATSTSTGPWETPLFMPRLASRISLEVTEVREQPLHAITEEDAIAEGVRICDAATANQDTVDPFDMTPYRAAYACRWDEVNGKRRRREGIPLGEPGYGTMRTVTDRSAVWAANPMVNALTFRRVRP